MALVSVEWLAAHRSDPDVRVCDVRWFLPSTGRVGRDEYLAGHLPGAVFVDLDHDLAGPDDGRAGRHPLPAAGAFEAAMRRAGVSPSTHVVAHDDAGGAVAARLWWLLRAHGHAQVSLLDGGLAAWKDAGLPLATGPVEVPAGSFASRPVPGSSEDLPSVRSLLRSGGLLLDARAPARYRGETEPVDARPGHVPAAVNLPFSDLLENGRFREPSALREAFGRVGVAGREVVASCGSGVTACHLLFALDHAGLLPFPQARLYAGSYSEWARHPELAVATGSAPGAPS